MANPFSTSSLYVGQLSNDISEGNLYEIFNSVGTVSSIRICRDAVTRRSLGYAYVNYTSEEDARKALEELNNVPIKGRPCRIMLSQRDPSLRKSGRGNIYIKNLDKSIDHKSLYDTFEQFGQIISCKIELDRNNESKGYGYIQYATQEAAETASKSVNNMMLAGKKVYVGPFISRKERIAQNISKEFTNIYIKNLNETVGDEQLQTLFSKFGTIKSAVIMKDSQGKSKGFAFINFDSPKAAEKAVEEMNNKQYEGKVMYVGRAQKKAEREAELRQKFEQIKQEQMMKYQGVNLYVKNLEDNIDDDKLRELFSQFGAISSSRVMRDPKGNSKGFGFVCFHTPDEATKAQMEMNGKILVSKPLYVALAQRKEDRRLQLEAQFSGRKLMAPGSFVPPTNPALFYGPGTPGFVYPPMVPSRGGRFGGQFPGNYVMMGRGGQMKGAKPGSSRGRGVKPNFVIPPAPIPILPQNVQVEPLPVVSYSKLTPQSLAAFPPEEQKNILGEQIFPLILKSHPDLAGKITGMFLDSLPIDEIISLIDNPTVLKNKIEEAIKILKESEIDK